MNRSQHDMIIRKTLKLGGAKPVLFAGPCAVESPEICLEIATKVKAYAEKHGFGYVFKASFDKANRTSGQSFRGIGFERSLAVLKEVGDSLQVPLLTDVHETCQLEAVAAVVDVIQIPAFLCRQTDLLLAAGKTGKAIKIKRGQFMAPEDMQFAVDKIRSTGNQQVCLTERGFCLGYHNLVVDMRALPIMRQFAPVVFDVTHSVQQPGGNHGSSGGQRELAPFLARAAGAAGVDGFFIETHPDPSVALSDGPNMVPLAEMDGFLGMLKKAWTLGHEFEDYQL
ncbi:2-dehydro-3-deoxyphosphooctonate aldolase (KDO 8-P synthase) [Cyclobacterium lianum]|uniref:2-dehydro-3-deoxyphosphooctonate aldolase n=1 Tax=Cyclobacterium lianum TaxID=388280 RepID=A0A1M7QD61_9BACT|nr:3-deoxy-8-phosphooctulonate synthase [Cyclobacterium lianum]SHN28656.1 2-dehydro-3-deoxyphosphooctonate aldolase (KDO 8-P synthase) [Cyclobacterium lianum]